MALDAEAWTVIATAVGVLVSLGAACFAASQARSAKCTLRLTRDSAEVAKEQAQIARDAVKESIRSRIDEQAPRVAMLMEAPEWPPFIDRSRNAMPGGGEPRLLEDLGRAAVAGPEPYYFDEQRSWLLWFRTRGILKNEGQVEARVRVDGESRFIAGTSNLAGAGHPIPIPRLVGSKSRKEHLLGPGESALFEWAYGHTLGEWADAYENRATPNPNGAGYFSAVSFDSGTIDYFFALLQAVPIVPVPGRTGQWQISEPTSHSVGVVDFPPERVYRLEGHKPPSPPWVTILTSQGQTQSE
jgi:hypothetical protein